MKIAEVLVVADLEVAARLRDVTKVSDEGLAPYQREIRAVEDMYRSIWQLHGYLDPTHWHKQPIVAWAFEQVIRFPNDQLLAAELAHERIGPYHQLVGELKDEIAPKWLPTIVERVDQLAETRMRLRGDASPVETLRGLIREVQAQAANQKEQLGLPGMDEHQH